jgi:UDP-N-acetyl-D-glucosamine dehydrogenase
MREHDFDLASVKLTAKSIASFDAIVLLTDHSDFDYDLIAQHAQVVIDTRGKFAEASNVERA